MGIRQDKSRAVVRYLTGYTGIPFLSWNGTSRLEAPAPYRIEVTTSRKLQNWHDLIRAAPEMSQTMVIRYDNSLTDVSHSWVAMPLGGFAPLLAAHYETIQDRIRGE